MNSTKNQWRLMTPDAFTKEDKDKLCEFIQTAERYSQSTKVMEFEKAWSKRFGYKHSVFVNSGSSANLILVAALKEIYGIEGLGVAQAVTWATNVAPIVQNGFDLQLCDISMGNFGPDLTILENILNTQNVQFLFLTHLLGFNATSFAMIEMLRRHGVLLIEDGCEATGARFAGKYIGNHPYSKGITYSFYYGHHMTTVEGGMVCTNDDEVYEKLRLLRSHGLTRESSNPLSYDYENIDPRFTFDCMGYNVRNTELAAVLGLSQLPRIGTNIRTRNANLNLFLEHLSPSKFFTDFDLEGVSNFCLPIIGKTLTAEQIQPVLNDLDIESRPIISGNLFHQPFLKNINMYRYDETAEKVHRHGLYVGNHQDVRPEQILELVRHLNQL